MIEDEDPSSIKTLAQEFDIFINTICPKGTEAERKNLKRIFYSGCMVILNNLHKISVEDTLSESRKVKLIEAYDQEIEDFKNEVVGDMLKFLKSKSEEEGDD